MLLAHAIAQLDQLDADAKGERRKTGEIIRPIMLIKAESRRGTSPVTFDVVKETPCKAMQISRKRKLLLRLGMSVKPPPQNLMAEDCQVRFVITVDALKEGWDCPFAYILCSVGRNLRRKPAVEQLLGTGASDALPARRKSASIPETRPIPSPPPTEFRECGRDGPYALEASAWWESGFNRLEARELITPIDRHAA